MKNLYFVLYYDNCISTHISLWIENDRYEYSYWASAGVRKNVFQKFNDGDYWKFCGLVPICKVDNEFCLDESVNSIAHNYTSQNYHWIHNNCWLFVGDLLEKENLKPKKETMQMIYKLNDKNCGVCPFSTYLIYSFLWYMTSWHDLGYIS